MNRDKYIQIINNIHKNISYNPERKVIDISFKNADDNFYKNILYKKLISFLQKNKIPDETFIYPKIKNIDLDLYFSCLYNYIFEIYNGVNHNKTCWSDCQKTIDVGYDKTGVLKKNLLKKYENVYEIDGWVKVFGINYNNFNVSRTRKVINYIKNIFKNQDRIIELIDKIKKDGWSTIKAKQKQGDNNVSNGVLGFSRKSNKFMVFHGKHRLIAAKYLINQSVLNDDLKIEYPIIEYNENNFRQTKLIHKCKCE